jgi:acyl-CoA reductase-like NAD-dependent aldehyde dehydrogenase
VVASVAAANICSVITELGGKSPMIVFEDCDIDSTVNGVIFGTFIAAG